MTGNPAAQGKSLALFCKVVDNFGDIGICWRLARQLKNEHGIAVTLWVDDLHSFQRICPGVGLGEAWQDIEGVTVRHWTTQDGEFSREEIADIVIEFFACDIPPGYIDAMAQCHPRPVWLNLEGLSAEEWVEGCHALPSMHPRLPLTKHFFFPGFTAKTGGLLHESALEEERRKFQENPAAAASFLQQLGASPEEFAAFKVSLFCYPHAPVSDLFKAWQDGAQAICCFVPEGVAVDAVQAFLGRPAVPGAVQVRGALTVRVLPFVPQADYDKLLWSCDFNFVRGEDSFVRAQWAERPFVWHIYPQDKNLHLVKLSAFLKRYASHAASLGNFSMRWNGESSDDVVLQADWLQLWSQLQADLPEIMRKAPEWKAKVLANGDLTSNLLNFAESIRAFGVENKV
ncbi:MAG: elongation factor P maturation arginine rhamnosyltransferase EarP [Burkholderiaceae bacterium]